MTESKHELLLWLNDLLQFKYSRVEQCGTGVAYCQIMHSIYKDVPLKKVIFDAKNDYDYSNNFRVLRSAFNMHNINKVRKKTVGKNPTYKKKKKVLKDDTRKRIYKKRLSVTELY